MSVPYDSKLSDSETPVLTFWVMWSTPSLPLLPGPLWPGVVVPVIISSMSQIELFNHFLRIIIIIIIIIITWLGFMAYQSL